MNSVEKFLHEDSRCDDEHQCQSDFDRHQHMLCSTAGLALRNRSATFFESRVKTQSCLVQGWRQAEKDACKNRYAERKNHHAMIDGHFARHRSDLGDCAETFTGQAHTPAGKQQTESASCKC